MTYSQRAKEVFESEIAELTKLSLSISPVFDEVIDLIYNCKGRLVVSGIGKTGIIGRKIASSLASTGTPSYFVNAAEAVHGDLGFISREDIVLLVSNSGETSEILHLIDPLRQLGCTLIAMTGDISSKLAKGCDYVLSTHVDKEACPLGLAPTTSTTAALMMGDAMMVCLMEKRHFKAENFAVYHPGGALGRKLLGRVKNYMSTDIPKVQKDATLRTLVREMSAKHLGMTLVYKDEEPVGIITDGDLRRALEKYDDLHITAENLMTPSFKYIGQDALLSEALAVMDKYNITTLPVENERKRIIGIISIHHIIDFN